MTAIKAWSTGCRDWSPRRLLGGMMAWRRRRRWDEDSTKDIDNDISHPTQWRLLWLSSRPQLRLRKENKLSVTDVGCEYLLGKGPGMLRRDQFNHDGVTKHTDHKPPKRPGAEASMQESKIRLAVISHWGRYTDLNWISQGEGPDCISMSLVPLEQAPYQWRILRYTVYTGGIPNSGGLKTLMKCVSSQKKVLRF